MYGEGLPRLWLCVKAQTANADLIKDQMDLLLGSVRAGRVYLGQWNYSGKCLDIIPQLVIRWEGIENKRQRSL